MKSFDFENDIRPLSEFRANAASMVSHVRKSGRPIVLTQHGKSAVVLLDVRHYQSMLSMLEGLGEGGGGERHGSPARGKA